MEKREHALSRSIYLSISERRCAETRTRDSGRSLSSFSSFSIILRGCDREITFSKSVKRARARAIRAKRSKGGKADLDSRTGQVLHGGASPKEGGEGSASTPRAHIVPRPRPLSSSRGRGDTNLLLFKPLCFLLFRACRSSEGEPLILLLCRSPLSVPSPFTLSLN